MTLGGNRAAPAAALSQSPTEAIAGVAPPAPVGWATCFWRAAGASPNVGRDPHWGTRRHVMPVRLSDQRVSPDAVVVGGSTRAGRMPGSLADQHHGQRCRLRVLPPRFAPASPSDSVTIGAAAAGRSQIRARRGSQERDLASPLRHESRARARLLLAPLGTPSRPTRQADWRSLSSSERPHRSHLQWTLVTPPRRWRWTVIGPPAPAWHLSNFNTTSLGSPRPGCWLSSRNRPGLSA